MVPGSYRPHTSLAEGDLEAAAGAEHTCAASQKLIGALVTAGQLSDAARIRARAGRSGCR